MIALYLLAFTIDGHSYVSARHMTQRQCWHVLWSTATDPDSFRHGQGVYTCRRER